MPTNILMPALSPTMEKGNLAKWLKKEGDTIKSGDILAEIETDKATMEVEAIDEGVLAKIVVPEGTADVPVNDVIAVIAGEGEDAKAVGKGDFAQPVAKPADDKAKAETAKQVEKAPTPASTNGSGQKAPQQAAAPQPQAQTNGAGRIFASPLARRLAKEGGLDLAAIQGSGPHGRIVERDIKAALEGGTAKKAQPGAPAAQAGAPAPKLAAAGMSDDIVKKMFEPGSFEEVPHDGMRKTIARRLTEAKQTIPHFYLTVDCDIDALLKLREQVNASAQKDKDGKPSFKVSVNDMVIKALALALTRTPGSNVTFTENAMLHHKHADISVAVAISGGLITPVIRKADTLTLSGIANAMKDFAKRAKDRKLKPDEYQGGTSAVSNLGMFGIKDFVAVINPPQSSIIAVGMGEKRAVVKNGEVVVGNVMSVTISCDHRAMDGAKGAELIAAFKQLIENPMAMLV
jgi:pyruvate dehydrogenase E2 component (dihydrolipoamide acetyltransferase)